ncbi:unnamed protein product [Lactuca saligna]|uniref:Uncharacterized protein n=1 Tax=Lactuca saligna TaxID=75948 RepID=A0AA35Z156_LACSI|nr:unnamed protein product [Lactuca saligna]
MVQPTVETRSQDLLLDDHVEQILKIKATMNEIRTIRDREREEEREFQKAMLTWMKQLDPEFFSDVSNFPNSIVKLLEPVVDDASRDTLSAAPTVLDEVDHECSNTSPEDELLSVVYASEVESKTPPLFLQPPLSLTTVEETSDMASDFQSYLPSNAIPVELMDLP